MKNIFTLVMLYIESTILCIVVILDTGSVQKKALQDQIKPDQEQISRFLLAMLVALHPAPVSH